MKTSRIYDGKWFVISEIDYIPVDDSEHGQGRKEIGKSTMIDFYNLVKIAKENGFDIPTEAFIHNYEAWRCDFKSNYNHNGICCYTPCGCNDLSFSLMVSATETYIA